MIREWIAHFLINVLMLNKVSPIDHSETVQALVRTRMQCDQLQSYANSLDLELVQCRREIEDLRRARAEQRHRREVLEAELMRRRARDMPMAVPPIETTEREMRIAQMRAQRDARYAQFFALTPTPTRRRPPFPGASPRTFNGTEPEDL